MNAKPLFVLLFFILFIALFASGATGGDADLSNQPVYSGGGSSGAIDYNVFAPGGSNGANSVVKGASIDASSSPCGSAYTVRTGDTLFGVSRVCGVTLEHILGLNPAITNPNLIHPGQTIVIFNATAVPKPTSTSTPKPAKAQPTKADAKKPEAKPTATKKPAATLEPIPGKKPGDPITVELPGFPPNAEVMVAIGKVGVNVPVIDTGRADEHGVFRITLFVPKTAKAKEKWTVSVVTVDLPKIRATSTPFTIGQ
jgi:LysM repeat protein